MTPVGVSAVGSYVISPVIAVIVGVPPLVSVRSTQPGLPDDTDVDPMARTAEFAEAAA